jgi:hypothetical protein
MSVLPLRNGFRYGLPRALGTGAWSRHGICIYGGHIS